MPGSDPLFVGEYDTDHEMIIVEMEIVNQFDASDWIVTERTVEGDNAITHAAEARLRAGGRDRSESHRRR